MRGDLVEAFERLAQSPVAQRGELRHVVVETTGLADPAPILHTLMGDPRLVRDWRLAGVACTVDAFNAMATLDQHAEAVKQAAVADRLLLTKTDLVPTEQLAPLGERLRAINPLTTLEHRARWRPAGAAGPAGPAQRCAGPVEPAPTTRALSSSP